MTTPFDSGKTHFENLSDANLTTDEIDGSRAHITALDGLSEDIIRGFLAVGTSHYLWLKNNGLTNDVIDGSPAFQQELENLPSDLVRELIHAARALRGEGGVGPE